MLTGVRDQVIKLRQASPCMTLAEIGQKVHRSRQCVSKILQKEQLPTRHWLPTKRCLNCDAIIPNTILNKKYCNRACEYEYNHIIVTCTNCGKLFRKRKAGILEYDKKSTNLLRKGKPRLGFFCNKQCFGHWVGTHNSERKHKYNYEQIWALHNQGLRNVDISKQLGIGEAQICSILHKISTAISALSQSDVPADDVIPPSG